MSEKWECPECGKGPADGLTLTPSGRVITRHNDGAERCPGRAPSTPDPEPVKIVPKNSKPNTAECVECGTEGPKLKTPGKIRKHVNPQTLAECEQRSEVKAACPSCERPDMPLYRMRFRQHKDLKANSKCPASGKTVAEAQALGKKAPVRPKADKPSAKQQASPLKALSPLEKSKFKADRLGKELAGYDDPWRYTIETGPDADQATLVARRGKGNDTEEMRISWWAGACLGGDGKITHEYKGRKIAVRNANAVRQRGQMSHEEITAEYAKVSTRKMNGAKKTKKTPAELQETLPFDPVTAPDKEVLAFLREGKTVRWTRVLDGQMERDVLRSFPKQPLSKTKTGIRQLTFTGSSGSRTIRLANLVSVG